MTRKPLKLSASAITAFKACPMRFRLAYIEGLRPVEETDALRMGTSWAKLQEVADLPVDSPCPCAFATLSQAANPECSICGGSGSVRDNDPFTRAINWLNDRYQRVPNGIEPEQWAVERAVLAYSFSGWLWQHSDSPVSTVTSEHSFELPIFRPGSSAPLPLVRLVGRIDKIVEFRGHNAVYEAKSTSKAIDSGSTYWDRANINTQLDTYMYAARQIFPDVRNVLWDVWRKPAIRPKKLSIAESKKYLGEHPDFAGEIIEGKGGPTIRETAEMFGERLLTDIQERPDFYFARKLVARTDADLDRFQRELYGIYKTIRLMEKHGLWWCDETQCEATFKCPYTSICYHHQDVCDGKTTPDGFRRIYHAD